MTSFESSDLIGRHVDFNGVVYRVSGDVAQSLMKNQKIQAIKQLRQEYSLGLIEAKQLADLIDTQFNFSAGAQSRKGKLSSEDFKLDNILKTVSERLIDFFHSLEARIDRLERRNIEVNKTEELRRLIEIQSDRLTAQSHRMDKLAKENLDLKRELEKRPRRRMILRKKEHE